MSTQVPLSANHFVAQVDASSGKVPKSAQLLLDIQYLERSLHRILCGWGNQFYDWDDKISVARHIWDQAEIVRRLRTRIEDFLGIKADQAVSSQLETLMNVVLCAPSFDDAIDGVYQIMSTALVNIYLDFIDRVNPIHDAPTHQIIQEIVTIKDLQRKWRSQYRRQHPHKTNEQYTNAIEQQLAQIGYLKEPLAIGDTPAKPVGVDTAFRPLTPRINQAWFTTPEVDLFDYISSDFSNSIESRRLFWPIGYMRELALAIDQLHWIYDTPYMPWQFHYDETRHMWDESRHGDSGYSRLKDFGITIEQVGFTYPMASELVDTYPTTPKPLATLTAEDMYKLLFSVCMVAETGHFLVKRESYADFRDGGDLQSAEMMLFDIIDETTHVQYGHRWLPVIAERAGVDCSNYEQEGAKIRKQTITNHELYTSKWAKLPREKGHPRFDQYQKFLALMRDKCPLSNAKTCPPRTCRPMASP